MKSTIILLFTCCLVIAGIGGREALDVDAASLRALDALPLLYATDPDLRRQEGVLYLGTMPVSGIVVQETMEGATWTPYMNGVRHGREVARYPGGAWELDRMWAEGLREGESRVWWPDGSLQEVSTYANDVLEGISKRWYADGTLASAFTWENGHEQGTQQMWYEDGTVRANYVVIDGRRFGSNGTKGCTSGVTEND